RDRQQRDRRVAGVVPPRVASEDLVRRRSREDEGVLHTAARGVSRCVGLVRIVVTGALGHIGSRLTRALPDTLGGDQIGMLDDFSTQRYPSLFDLPAGARYRFHESDVLGADLDELFGGADVVVHLAAITNAEASFDRQTEVERVNLHGTERVARACIRAGAG